MASSSLANQFEQFVGSNLFASSAGDQQSTWSNRVWSFLELNTGLKRERISTILIVLTIVYFVFGSVLPLLSHLISTIYPIFQSIKIIQNSSSDYSHQVLYWIIFAVVSILDFTPIAILPFYYFAKSAFFVYLYSSPTDGISILHQYVDPFLKSLNSTTDNVDQVESQ